MNALEGVRIALTALQANLMRSILTTLGVVIGVAAVIAMTAIGTGAAADIQARINKLGSNLLFITPGKAQSGRIGMGFGSGTSLLVTDAKDIRKELTDVLAGVAPEVNVNTQIKVGNQNNNYTCVGTYSDYYFVHAVDLDAGRFFNRLDEDASRRVCVIGGNLVNDVFGGITPAQCVGKQISIKAIPFEVIGVMTIIGGFGRADDQIFIPLSTCQQRLQNLTYLRLISVSVRLDLDVNTVESQVEKWLRHQHRLRYDQDDDFSMRTQADIAATLSDTSRTFTLLLAGIAAISLVVGGIGIMNIMLVTVTERTREIGIRKALGATQHNIQLQFLIESVTLSVLGGTIGVGLGIGAAALLQSKVGLTTIVTTSSIIISFGCSAAIGIFFGYYPAKHAGSLDPIQALRHE
jgi:ABC-type antimicrobial peptide transport system permease subunit